MQVTLIWALKTGTLLAVVKDGDLGDWFLNHSHYTRETTWTEQVSVWSSDPE